MFAPDLTFEKALHFSRFDPDHPLSTGHGPILLEKKDWSSPEHYVNSMIARSPLLKAKTLAAPSGLAAYKLVKPWYRPKIRNWSTLRRILMMRALYTKLQMYPEVRNFLSNTQELIIIETSAYDHYWGIGRDQRGENIAGKIWMNIRDKIECEEKSHWKPNNGQT